MFAVSISKAPTILPPSHGLAANSEGGEIAVNHILVVTSWICSILFHFLLISGWLKMMFDAFPTSVVSCFFGVRSPVSKCTCPSFFLCATAHLPLFSFNPDFAAEWISARRKSSLKAWPVIDGEKQPYHRFDCSARYSATG